MNELKRSHKPVPSKSDAKTNTFTIPAKIINWCLFYKIPKSNFVEVSKPGTCLRAKQFYRKVPFYRTRILGLYCYPNGDSKENEGYISLMFDEKSMLLNDCTVKATFALVDANGDLRHPPRSFSLDNSDGKQLHHTAFAKYKTFGMSQYMRREALLLSDIFQEEGTWLYVRCEIQYNPQRVFSDLSEFPYVMRHSKVRERQKLIITNKNHPLWEILCENSPYFKKLLVKDGVDKIYPFYKEDYMALNVMAKSIMKREEPHFYHIDQVFDLYQFADRVLMFEFKQSSSDFLKEHMTSDIVVDVIVMADMHSDPGLKSFAIQFAKKHWQEVSGTKNWKRLLTKCPDLAKEINEYNYQVQETKKPEELRNVTHKKTAEHVEEFNFYR